MRKTGMDGGGRMTSRLKRDFRFLLFAAWTLSFSAKVPAQSVGPALTSPPRVAGAPDAAMSAEYGDVSIAPGDVISITTYGAPELSTSAQTSASTIFAPAAPILQGVKVGAMGDIVLPYLGTVKVAGLTPSEAR